MLCFDNNTVTGTTKASAQAMWLSVAALDVDTPLLQIQDCLQEILGMSGTVVVCSGAEEALQILAGPEDSMYTSVGDPLYALTRPRADTPVPKALYGFLTLANEEYGVIYDVTSQAKAMKKANPGIVTVLDITQAIGRLKLDPLPKEIDAVILDSRTCYCGAGLGALWVRDEAMVQGRGSGGFQQSGYRSGWLNPMHVAGFAVALQEIRDNQEIWAEYIARLRHNLDLILQGAGGFVLNYADAPLVCNTSNYHIEGIWTKPVVLSLRQQGVRISDTVGDLFETTLCTPLTLQRFEVEARYSNLRISLSALNTEREVAQVAKRVIRAVNIARAIK